jgi:alpha-L-fucosidase
MPEMRSETIMSVNALKAGGGKLFDEGTFGMFIHWGLYPAYPAFAAK